MNKIISSLTMVLIGLASTAYASDRGYWYGDLELDFGTNKIEMYSKVKSSKAPYVKNQKFNKVNTNIGNVLAISNVSTGDKSVDVDTLAIGANVSVEHQVNKGHYSSANQNFGNVAAISNITRGIGEINVNTTAIGAMSTFTLGEK